MVKNKKRKEFLPFAERKIIMQNLKGVLDVIEFDDSDRTCVDVSKAKSIYKDSIIKFANGDRNDNTTPGPEQEFCNKNDIETLFGIGGETNQILVHGFKNGKKNN